jgi:tetratricopeptide (TPR) repeat protein
VAVALLALASPAAADPSDDDLARARTYFEAGRAHYALGNYSEALVQFTAGYQLAPARHEFLINLGVTYRRLRQLDRAKQMFERYLLVAPTGPERGAAQRNLAEIAALERTAPQPTAVPERPPSLPLAATALPPPQPIVAPEQPAPQVIAAPAPAPAPPTRHSRAVRHLAWILPTVAVLLAGAAVGIYYGTRPGSRDVCSAPAAGVLCVQ